MPTILRRLRANHIEPNQAPTDLMPTVRLFNRTPGPKIGNLSLNHLWPLRGIYPVEFERVGPQFQFPIQQPIAAKTMDDR